MSAPTHHLPAHLLTWLTAHAGFPARRLPGPAETLLCVAAAAALDEGGEGGPGTASFGLQRRDSAKDSALKTHALRRSRVHFKCDNSAKV